VTWKEIKQVREREEDVTLVNRPTASVAGSSKHSGTCKDGEELLYPVCFISGTRISF
jgi:hypothetical protein